MIPKSISATALAVADSCLARYAAENFYRAKGPGGFAANLGTACHGALEMYVKHCYIDKTNEPTYALLIDLFKMSYMSTFGTSELGEGYNDGVEMLTNWFKRADFTNVEVISAEKKDNFIVKTSAGPIPFNYIWDRFDRLPDDVYRVVDYKSSVWNVRPEDLHKKIQARCYGLAAAIQLKSQGIEYKRIKVEFDMLRFDAVGTVYSRADIAATWTFIKKVVNEKIIPTDADKAPETLNPECRFCVRKQVCKALTANIAAGGIFGLSIEQIIDRRAALDFQIKGINAAIREIDETLLLEAKEKDVIEFESDMNRAFLGLTKTNRKVDADRVKMAVGEEIFDEYGALAMSIPQWEKLCKDPRLTEQQKRDVKSLASKPMGNEVIRVENKSVFAED